MRLLIALLLTASLPLGARAGDFPKEIAQQAIDATIRLVSREEKGGAGTGVIIGVKDEFAYALTAKHVIQKRRERIDVLARVGDKVVAFPQVDVLAEAADADLALIRFPIGAAKVATMELAPKSDDLKRFPFRVLKVGWQLDSGATCLEDAALDRKLLKDKDGKSAFFWQTRDPSDPGRSGGPLVSRDGKLLGICSGNQEERGYFTHRDEIHYFLRKDSSSAWLVAEPRKR
jgi:S1-C subfamily serine protease